MNFLILGRGKTGALVAQCAKERHHHVRVLGADENRGGKALTPDLLRDVNAVIDFTAPTSVMDNIQACLREKKNMVVGTTGWHAHARPVRDEVEKAGIGFLHGANFSVGVNLFFEAVRSASGALKHGARPSFREGDVVGLHEVIFDSPNDRIYLCHDAKSRYGYAEGAVLGAEWISGKSGFYDFKDMWREL